MLGPDPGIVEAGRDRVALDDLAVLVAEHVAARAVQHRDLAAADRGGVVLAAVSARLDADQPHGVVAEGMEGADRVRPAAHAGDDRVGQPVLALEQLGARLTGDHRLQLAHEQRVGMRSGGRSDQVVRVLDVRDPVADRLVHGVLERRGARGDGAHLRAEQAHAHDVRSLPARVLLAHVHDALHAEARAHGGRCDAVLAGAGLRDDPPLAEALGDQRLPDGVVDLVRTRVREVLALQIDARTADVGGQALGQVDRRRAADVVAREAVALGREGRIGEAPRRPRPRARRAPPSRSRERTGLRSARTCRARRAGG